MIIKKRPSNIYSCRNINQYKELLQVNTPFPPMTKTDLISLKSACNFHYFTITTDTVHTPLNLRTFFSLRKQN